MEPGQITITRPDGTNVLLNQGTPYTVSEFNPLNRGVRSSGGGTVPWGDGEWAGAQWRSGAEVPLTVDIDGTGWGNLMDLYWALGAVLEPVRTGSDLEITWNAAGTEYLMYGRPGAIELRRWNLERGQARVSTELSCLDPAIYSALEHTTEIGLLHRIGGLATPFGLPTSIYSVIADGEATLTNAGTAQARLLLHLQGPVAAPRITLIDDVGVHTMFLDTVLGEDDYLDIDTKDKVVILNGQTSRLADQFGAWPLLSGTALIRFEADIYEPDARLTIRHRDTW